MTLQLLKTTRRDLVVSIAMLAVVVLFALIGLATDHNWPKMLRVSLAFIAYSGVLLGLLRSRRRSPAAAPALPLYWFNLAGAAAGIVSGLVRPQFDLNVLIAGTLGAALIFGSVHWLALRTWRIGVVSM